MGCAAAAGGFGAARGGAGGGRLPPEPEADGADFATGAAAAAATAADCPGNGLDTGFGLEVVLGWVYQEENNSRHRRSLPWMDLQRARVYLWKLDAQHPVSFSQADGTSCLEVPRKVHEPRGSCMNRPSLPFRP